ncbi:MAG: cytochrome b [Paracoccaceae bacterium]|nr:MAG: cytochrome b [Paracoccaceae bacterium]
MRGGTVLPAPPSDGERTGLQTPMGYSLPQKILHWAVAVLVIGMVPAGIVISDFDNKPWVEAYLGPGGFDRLYDLHKNVGVIVLALVAIRLAVRAVQGQPPYYPPLPVALRIMSRAVHWALYALLIAAPLIGWIGVSAYPALPDFFGLGRLPALTGPDRALAESLLRLHGVLGIAIGVLAVVHVLAALWHGIIRRDGVLARMTWG